MRIFIGLKASKKVEELALVWRRDKLDWSVRWLKGKNLHLTLVPPFYLHALKGVGAYENEAAAVAAVAEKLAAAVSAFKPFTIKYETIGYGPGPGAFRLIWATGRASYELEKLKDAAEKSLGSRTEPRRLLPHLTLARFRSEDFARFKVKTLAEKIAWPEEIKSLIVFESRLSPQGAEYLPLAEIKLGP